MVGAGVWEGPGRVARGLVFRISVKVVECRKCKHDLVPASPHQCTSDTQGGLSDLHRAYPKT